jgi:hypothetical protein
MGHWLDTVMALLQSETTDLRQLAIMAGGNPKTFYRGTRIEDIDPEGQDLSGLDFGREQNARFLAELLRKAHHEGKLSAMEISYLNNSPELLKALQYLSPRAERVFREKLGVGVMPQSYSDIATQFGVTRERIRQIYNKTIRALIRYLEAEYKNVPDENILEEDELSSKSLEALDEISLATKQEERLAILFKAILSDHRVGPSMLRKYTFENSKLASETINQMRTEMNEPNFDSRRTHEYIIFSVRRAITDAYPLRKGEMLLYLAKHLADFPETRNLIQERLNSTKSMFVEPIRAKIQSFLDKR